MALAFIVPTESSGMKNDLVATDTRQKRLSTHDSRSAFSTRSPTTPTQPHTTGTASIIMEEARRKRAAALEEKKKRLEEMRKKRAEREGGGGVGGGEAGVGEVSASAAPPLRPTTRTSGRAAAAEGGAKPLQEAEEGSEHLDALIDSLLSAPAPSKASSSTKKEAGEEGFEEEGTDGGVGERKGVRTVLGSRKVRLRRGGKKVCGGRGKKADLVC